MARNGPAKMSVLPLLLGQQRTLTKKCFEMHLTGEFRKMEKQLRKVEAWADLKSFVRRLRHHSRQISNSTPISMICPLGIWKYAPGRWALWCMNANSSSRQRAMPDRRPLAMIVS